MATRGRTALVEERVGHDLGPCLRPDRRDGDHAGSITVGGITLPIPAGKVLRSKVAIGAFVTASAKVKTGVLTLKKVKVESRAVTPAV